MTARIHSKALTAAALLAALTLAACGGASSSKSAGGGKPSAADRAKERQEIARLRRSAFGPNPKAKSGRIDGTVDIDVTGVKHFNKTIEVTTSGPYRLKAGSAVPDALLSVAMSLREKSFGGDLILADGKPIIGLGTTGYKIPEPTASNMVAPAAAAKNGLTKTLALFFIAPQRWERDAHIVGPETIAGEDTTHVTTGVRADRFFEDAARLTRMLTSIRITEISGLPTAIPPAARKALVRSVVKGQGDVWIGKADGVMRRARLDLRLRVKQRDRKVLSAMKTLHVVADLDVTDVGQPQDVAPPKQYGSYADLQTTLDVLGEAMRRELRGG
jgi:hypothetical protein